MEYLATNTVKKSVRLLTFFLGNCDYISLILSYIYPLHISVTLHICKVTEKFLENWDAFYVMEIYVIDKVLVRLLCL